MRRNISHTWVLLYSLYFLLNICFARGIHVRALSIPIPFRVVQVCRLHVLFFPFPFIPLTHRPFFSSPSFCPASLPFPLPACVLTYLYPTQYAAPPLFAVSRRLLVSASTDRLGRGSYGASARVGFHVYSGCTR
ncbi:hypothetical protein B0H11DRAFT_1990228, partial [Mycena galericulata]